jgi:hypothetical protein
MDNKIPVVSLLASVVLISPNSSQGAQNQIVKQAEFEIAQPKEIQMQRQCELAAETGNPLDWLLQHLFPKPLSPSSPCIGCGKVQAQRRELSGSKDYAGELS